MWRKNVKVLFCVMLLISLISPSVITDLAPPLEMMISPFSPTPVAASEEENVDSMSVFPSNRWTVTNEGYTAAVANSLFTMSDTGDESVDYYQIKRGLRSLDGKIEMRFKVDSGNAEYDANSAFYVYLVGSGTNSLFYLKGIQIRDGMNVSTSLNFLDTDGVLRTKTLTGLEQIVEGTWYRLKIKYDYLESEVEFKLYANSGTKIWAYDNLDISSTTRPGVFDDEFFSLALKSSSGLNGKYVDYVIDYVKAPFKEREWTHTTTPSDSDFLYDNWDVCEIQDDITNDRSCWRLVIPYFDTCSGTLTVHQLSDFSDYLDDMHYLFTLYGVDGDDGGVHKIGSIEMWMQDTNEPTGNALRTYVHIQDGGSNRIWEHSDEETIEGQVVQFSIGMSDDRSSGSIKVKADLDDQGSTWGWSETGVYEFAVSDWVTDPSSEFILEVDYDIDGFQGNSKISFALNSFGAIERDWFTGTILPIVGGIVGIFVAGLSLIFLPLMRFLGEVFKFVGDLIVTAVAALGPLITAMQDVLNTAIGAVASAVDGLISYIEAIAAAIWSTLEPVIGDVIDWFITSALTLVAAIFGLIVGIIFWAWDSVNFPDVLQWVALLLDYMIEFVDWTFNTANQLLTLIFDLSWLILVGWWVWAVLIQWGRARFEPLGGVANFIDAYFNDSIPFDIFGCHIYIPQGIVFTLWLILIMPSDFALWTAMG